MQTSLDVQHCMSATSKSCVYICAYVAIIEELGVN